MFGNSFIIKGIDIYVKFLKIIKIHFFCKETYLIIKELVWIRWLLLGLQNSILKGLKQEQ